MDSIKHPSVILDLQEYVGKADLDRKTKEVGDLQQKIATLITEIELERTKMFMELKEAEKRYAELES